MPTPADLALAACLIMAPVGTREPDPEPDQYPAAAVAVVQVAVAWELYDDQETLFRTPRRWQADLDTVRQRRVDLAGCPLAGEGWWLPENGAAEAYYAFNVKVRAHLDERIVYERDRLGELQAAKDECVALAQPLSDVVTYRSPWVSTMHKRWALARVRDKIGRAAWDAREMTPYLPYWRFGER